VTTIDQCAACGAPREQHSPQGHNFVMPTPGPWNEQADGAGDPNDREAPAAAIGGQGSTVSSLPHDLLESLDRAYDHAAQLEETVTRLETVGRELSALGRELLAARAPAPAAAPTTSTAQDGPEPGPADTQASERGPDAG
jgi:hypothetical protein